MKATFATSSFRRGILIVRPDRVLTRRDLQMSELDDLVEEYSGVKLHRKRVLTAFGHVEQGPLLNLLFKMTRPPLRKTKPAKNVHHEKLPAPTIIRKGMVDYRRSLGRNELR
ncbi:MAG: hypothetical protein ABSH03_06650 [Candidatus Lustribacter sp.]